MRVMVAGAAGMLGQDVVGAAQRRGHDVAGLAHHDLDITDPVSIDDALAELRPEAIIDCAAWSDVDGAEDDERGAMTINDTGAGLLAAAAARIGASILYPSSDYVFDGTKRTPYLEGDMPEPINAYGRSKLGGEVSVAAANPKHFIVRTSWLYGLGGGNFVETMLRLAASQNEVLVVHDQVGSPTYTWHLAYGIVRLIEGLEHGIHHMAAAGQCSWYEFAREIFEQAKVECKVLSATTDMLGRPAPRPAFSALKSQREHAIELPSWQDGLAGYIAQRESEKEVV